MSTPPVGKSLRAFLQDGRMQSYVRPLCAAPMAAGPDDIRGVPNSGGLKCAFPDRDDYLDTIRKSRRIEALQQRLPSRTRRRARLCGAEIPRRALR